MTLKQLRKAKYSILASIFHIFKIFFLTEPHTYLCNTTGKSLAVNLDILFKKFDVLEKFILPFFFEQDPFGLNTERYEVSLHIHSESGKMRIRITPNTDTSHAVKNARNSSLNGFLLSNYHSVFSTIF